MTKKTGGLGSLAKGLEWITQETNSTSQEQLQSINQLELEQAKAQKPEKESKQTAQTTKHRSAKDHTTQSATAGLPTGFTRATFIVRSEHIDCLKALSYTQKTPLKELVNNAFKQFLKNKDVNTILLQAVRDNSSNQEGI